MTFGEKLQKLRKARALTQEALAQQIGVSRQALSKWESDAVLPDTENVIRLSDLFGVTTDYLLRDSPANVNPPDASDAAPNTPAPDSNVHPDNSWPSKGAALAGGILSALSLVGLLVMGIISSLGNYEILNVSGTLLKHGLFAFLEARHLEWLFCLLLLLAFAGGFAVWLSWKNRKHR